MQATASHDVSPKADFATRKPLLENIERKPTVGFTPYAGWKKNKITQDYADRRGDQAEKDTLIVSKRNHSGKLDLHTLVRQLERQRAANMPVPFMPPAPDAAPRIRLG
jgi:hypothetical protein